MPIIRKNPETHIRVVYWDTNKILSMSIIQIGPKHYLIHRHVDGVTVDVTQEDAEFLSKAVETFEHYEFREGSYEFFDAAYIVPSLSK